LYSKTLAQFLNTLTAIQFGDRMEYISQTGLRL